MVVARRPTGRGHARVAGLPVACRAALPGRAAGWPSSMHEAPARQGKRRVLEPWWRAAPTASVQRPCRWRTVV